MGDSRIRCGAYLYIQLRHIAIGGAAGHPVLEYETCVEASGFVIEFIRINVVLFRIFIMKNERDYVSWTILQLRTELGKRKVKKTMSRKEICEGRK